MRAGKNCSSRASAAEVKPANVWDIGPQWSLPRVLARAVQQGPPFLTFFFLCRPIRLPREAVSAPAGTYQLEK